MFSFHAFSIEISNDLFIEENNEEETVRTGDMEEEDFAFVEPNIKKVYKKEKVMIKRDLSSLSHAVKNLSEEESAMNTSLTGKLSKHRGLASDYEEESTDYEEEESANYVDYGDYEIHWDRKKD